MIKETNSMNERIGAVSLGEPTDKKFITSLLPEGRYEEIVYENDTSYACKCRKLRRDGCSSYMDDKDGDTMWDEFFESVKNEFGENFIECYSITSYGAHFVIYLKKSK